jgi:ethanolamine utilization microcompartment shell protein EutS
VPYLAHTVSRTGAFLSKEAGVPEGTALAYLIAPPLESMYALDAAMKAADVKLQKLYAPPSETNFGGGLLSGSQSACEAACAAFAQAVAEANLTDNNIILLVNRDDPMRVRIALAIGEMLEAAGLVVTIPELSGQDYINALKWEQYDLYLGQTKLSPNMDLTAFFSADGNLNCGGLDDPVLYALCMDALANIGNYYNLHQRVLEKGLLCPILFRSYAVYAARGLVTNLNPARDNLFCYSIGRTMEDAFTIEEI